MPCSFRPLSLLRTIVMIGLAAGAVLAGDGVARADLIKLSSGGELRGKIVKGRATRESVTLETLSGAVVTVSRAEMQFLTMRPVAVEEYESRARKLPETAEAHWEMADWCKQKALLKQRETHLRRVVELAPDHDQAHQMLGHVLTKSGWTSRDEMMERQGYVKHRGKYITTQELELVEKTESERQDEKAWFQKVKLWSGWLRGTAASNPDKPREGWQALESINDPHAAPAVTHYLSEHERREVRLLAVKILSHVGGDKAVPGLVKLSLKDGDHDIRYQALQGITPAQHTRALPMYVKELKNDFNPVVRRAGAALGILGGDKAVNPLIDALVTTHSYQVRVPGTSQQSYSFSTDGSFGGGNSLSPDLQAQIAAGQFPNGVIVLDGTPGSIQSKTKLVTVTVNHQNAEVLTALQKLTGKNFGYDKRTWHLWWAAEKNQGKS